MTKHIFVTGGVVSSLGKGLTSASVGMLLEKRGLSVRLQKLDPYINVDPAMLSPAQHGEIYVLDDGSEADLDLGHYERFTNSPLTRDSTWTTGQIYLRVIERERRGGYNGQTVQVIPHITNEIKSCISRLSGPDVDVVITEIGGTVGDIESLPFLEAIRQFALEIGKQNCLYIHLTLVPYLKVAGELKTKPTQHSVSQLRHIGIQPDILVCRSEVSIPQEDKAKMALFCNVSVDSVIEEKDKDFSIYEVPLSLKENGIDRLIVERLGLSKAKEPDMSNWQELMHRLRNPKQEVTIAVIGKYAETKDAYKSVYESLDHAGIAHQTQIRFLRIPTEQLSKEGEIPRILGNVDGILLPGGFGERSIEGKVAAVRFAREHNIPFFGIGIGLQAAVIEYARNVLKLENANSTEFDTETQNPVFCLLDEQAGMRRGAHPIIILPESRMFDCYKKTQTQERHRHRYELNNAYRKDLENGGMRITATSLDGTLVEAVELPQNAWHLAVPFHPEYKSQPTQSHPLFYGFLAAAIQRKKIRPE